MLRVGLTGGLASGKSFVGKTLADLGCLVIRNDEIGHQVIQPDGEAYDAVVREFGAGILQPDGTIDRRKLAGIVFHDPERLAKLNAAKLVPGRGPALKTPEEVRAGISYTRDFVSTLYESAQEAVKAGKDLKATMAQIGRAHV